MRVGRRDAFASGVAASLEIVALALVLSSVDQVPRSSAGALKASPSVVTPTAMEVALRNVAGREFRRPLGGADVAVHDGAGQLVGPQYRDQASALNVRIAATQAESLSIRVSYAPGDAEGDAQGHCDIGLKLGVFTDCSARSLDDGATVIVKSKLVTFSDRTAAATVYILGAEDAAGRTDVWLQRSVEVIRDGTTTTSASDAVLMGRSKGPRVTLTDDALLMIAADPTLYLARPPLAADGCGTWRLEGGVSVECD